MSQQYPPCTLHQISEHVWWFTPEDHTDRPSLVAVTGTNRIVLLDIGASPRHTKQFLDALSGQGISDPDYAILTHWHWDHVFGIDVLTCPIVSHIETARNLQRMVTLDYSDSNLSNLVEAGHEVPFTQKHMQIELTDTERKALVLREPDIIFTEHMQISLGDVTCDIHHVGGDHASDAVVIYIPEDKVLFLGDCFYYTVYQEPQHYTRAKVLPLIDKLESFDAQQIIYGHSGEINTPEMLQDEFDLIRACYQQIDKHGEDQVEKIKAELYSDYDDEDVDFYLETIMAGLNLN